MKPRVFAFAILALAAATSSAHRAPNSVVKLDFGAEHVHAEVMVPRSELAHALPALQDAAGISAYLLHHIAAQTPEGAPWGVKVRAVRDTSYLEHDYVLAELELTPPRGASPRRFVLINDAVTHEVRNHIVWVIDTGSNEFLGALQYPARRLLVAPPESR
jgi:hypothetical protein